MQDSFRMTPIRFRCLLIGIFSLLFSVSGFAQTNVLSFKPVAFDYSKKLDRLILISANPNRLHIYDPVTTQLVSVPLVQPPLSVSVSPDGLRAAVGHDALISYVDLEKGSVLKTYNVPTTVTGVVAHASWVYTYGSGYSGSPQSLNLATGQTTPNTAAFSMTGAKLNPALNVIYGARDGTSPNDVERWEISTGPVTKETDSPYHGDFCIYGPVWFSPDGSRIYTGCGTVFRASADPKLDMYYLSSIPSVNQIAALDESSALQRVALLRRNNSFGSPTIDERVVTLLDSSYLGLIGQFTLASFAVGGKSYAAYGRGLFFSSGSTDLIVVKQADAASGLLNDFAVERISLSVGGDCGAAFATSSVDIPAEGASGSVSITGPAGCLYQASTLAPWITLVSGALGSGGDTLQWFVAANQDSVPRTGTIILPGHIFTVNQAAGVANSPLYVPGYYAVDAAYAKPVNKMITVSSNPNRLHIVDLSSFTETVVSLNSPPLSLSVDPAGAQAAVGHDGRVTLVDVARGSVIREFSVSTDVHALILAGNGYAYLFPGADWGNLFSLELGSGLVTQTSAIYDGREPRLHVDGKHIYVGGNWQSKWDISGGVAKVLSSVGTGGCGKLWLTEDGRRMFGQCGKAYTTSDVASQDYQYNGSLSNTTGIVWLNESASTGTTAVIPSAGPAYSTSAKSIDDTQVQLYGDTYLTYSGAIPLPVFTVGGRNYAAHGRFAFWDQPGASLYVVVQADSTALLTGGTGIAKLSVSAAKQVSVDAFVNSASQAAGRAAPGELISIYGSGMGPKSGLSFSVDPLTQKVSTVLGGTQVFINGVAAPVLYASDTQVNAVVPFEFPTSGQYILQVGSQGILSPGVSITAAAASPAVFTLDGSGSRQAIAVNLDGTICDADHPAARGSFILVFSTGGGQTSPSGATGSIAGLTTLKRLNQTQATIGDVPATVSFAGAAPSLIEGVNQLNVRINENAPVGNAQTLIITTGNNSSPATATIAVR
jgi:uncharacterized protein (TIGR03437 family)